MTDHRPLAPSRIDELLVETSRTFALAVPLLPEPTRTTVGLAYLLFRCADTLEDAASWTVEERREALAELAHLLEGGEGAEVAERARAWLARDVSEHAGYCRLLAELPALFASVAALPPATAAVVRAHTRRTALGMRAMVEEASTGGLASMEALRSYCYAVAGIVGELLTDVFLLDVPALERVRDALAREQVLFGEGLQLVNILKDERDDASEGRRFLPARVTREEVLALAADDLAAARRYVAALERGNAPSGFVAFTALPCELAVRTLEALRTQGPGAKVPRPEVLAMFAHYRSLAEA